MNNTIKTKKCTVCGEVKSSKGYYKDNRRNSYHCQCKDCENGLTVKRRNTEIGFLKHRYNNMRRNPETQQRGRRNKRLFTFDEFLNAFEKHKSIYGMRSAWGPGPDRLEEHLPMTMIFIGKGQEGKKGVAKGTKQTVSNLSVDRLDSEQDYTLQNIIFIRCDENQRKKNTTYEDCKIQIKLHEERFRNEME